MAVGPVERQENGKIIPLDVRIGDKDLFGKWSGTESKLDGQEVLVMKEPDILGALDS